MAIFPIFTLLRRVQLLGPLRSNQTSGDGRKILPLSHEVLFEKEYLLFVGFAAISFESIWGFFFLKVKGGGGGVEIKQTTTTGEEEKKKERRSY